MNSVSACNEFLKLIKQCRIQLILHETVTLQDGLSFNCEVCCTVVRGFSPLRLSMLLTAKVSFFSLCERAFWKFSLHSCCWQMISHKVHFHILWQSKYFYLFSHCTLSSFLEIFKLIYNIHQVDLFPHRTQKAFICTPAWEIIAHISKHIKILSLWSKA